MDRSTPDKIAQTGKLSDRIARLGLGSPSTSPTSATSTASPSRSPDSVRTGAVTRVSDKISRFQAQAEDRPLLPEGGSFGLAPAKPRSSTGGVGGSGSRDRHGDERQRVVSLGAGRAPVPLGVVTPRSVSANTSPNLSLGASSPSTVSPALSRSSSTASSRNGAPALENIKVPSANEGAGGEATPVASPDGSRANRNTAAYLDTLPPMPRTPGAVSVSSMRVETGSIASEGRASTTDLDLSASDLPTPTHSPLSSPIISGLTVSALTTGSVSSADGIAPAKVPSLLTDLKGPILNASRPGSVVSFSSMTVEAPSEDVANVSAASSSTSEPPAATATVQEEQTEEEGANETRVAESDLAEAERIERTRQELAQYEEDVEDPPAPSPFAAPGERNDEAGAPVEPPFLREDDSVGSVADKGREPEGDAAPTSPLRKASPIPDVKCSDCGQDVPLLEYVPRCFWTHSFSITADKSIHRKPCRLADHSCDTADVPEPSTPPAASTPLAARVPVLSSRRADPDVPDEPLEDDILDPNVATSDLAGRAKKSSQEDKLDAFVPQTEDLVPEDVLDAYGDEENHAAEHPSDHEPQAETTAVPASAKTSVDSFKRESGTGMPRSPSSDLPLPGRYYTSDDEDHGEPGSATIVRSASTQ